MAADSFDGAGSGRTTASIVSEVWKSAVEDTPAWEQGKRVSGGEEGERPQEGCGRAHMSHESGRVGKALIVGGGAVLFGGPHLLR